MWEVRSRVREREVGPRAGAAGQERTGAAGEARAWRRAFARLGAGSGPASNLSIGKTTSTPAGQQQGQSRVANPLPEPQWISGSLEHLHVCGLQSTSAASSESLPHNSSARQSNPTLQTGNQSVVHNSCMAEWGFDPRTSPFCSFLHCDSNSFSTNLQITSCPWKPNHHQSPSPEAQTLTAFSPSLGLLH